jgi:hypothetical protein
MRNGQGGAGFRPAAKIEELDRFGRVEELAFISIPLHDVRPPF